MATVCFIRHAESEANADLPAWSSKDVGLTEKGCRQAKAIAESFPIEPSLIVTSSYTRSKQTAYPTLQRFPDVPHKEWPVHEFTYLACSQQYSTRKERQPLVEDFWRRNDPNYVDGEGAESFYEFIGRVSIVFENVTILNDMYDSNECIVIFSHGQLMRAILWRLKYGSFPTNMKRFRHFLGTVPLANADILEISYWGWQMKYRLIHAPSLRPPFPSFPRLRDIKNDLVCV